MEPYIEKTFTPEQLSEELAARAYEQSALIILPVRLWDALEEAYNSPLTKRIRRQSMTVFPTRAVETKELSFQVYSADFKSKP